MSSSSFIYAPCIIDSEHRLRRNIKWLDYYGPILNDFGVDHIWLIDNASPMEELKKLGGEIYNLKFDLIEPATTRPYLKILRYEQRFERVRFRVYHYFYRALFTGIQTLPRQFEYTKAIHIDTDVYVLSKRLAAYIKDSNTGWEAFWCKKYNFAESTFHIICQDSFHIGDKFIADSFPIEKYDDRDAENIIPFTNVSKSFIGDRYGESSLVQAPAMDYYCQSLNDVELVYEKRF